MMLLKGYIRLAIKPNFILHPNNYSTYRMEVKNDWI